MTDQTSVFDAEAFMAQTTTEEGSTVYATVEEGDYQSIIDKTEPRQGTDKNGNPFLVLDVFHEILDEAVRTQLGLTKVIVKQGVFVEFLPNGAIDWSEGKNVKLGRLREAIGQNKPGASWSPSMLPGGGPLMIHVIKRPAKDGSDDVYNEVTKTAAMPVA